MKNKIPKLSIVSTLYNSENTLEEFLGTHTEMARQLVKDDFEIILVNDGSPDKSLAMAVELSRQIPNLKLVELSRNFGQHRALLTGMREATGDLVYICDSDMEEPAKWLEMFWNTMHASGGTFDLVGGVQGQRVRGFFNNFTSGLSWKLFSYLSSHTLTPNLVTARLMTSAFKDAVLSYTEKTVFLATLCSEVGFQQTFIPLEKQSLTPTSYTFVKKLSMLLDGITAFSIRPLYLSIIFSGLLALFGFATLLMTVYTYFSVGTLPGWASVMAVLSLSFAATFFVLSIQGLYIGKIFQEVRNRPHTIVKSVFKNGKKL